jgi:hypothetical protein
MGLLQTAIDAIEVGGSFGEALVEFADAQERAGLGEQFTGSKWAQEIGVGTGFETGDAGRGSVVVRNEEDWNKIITEALTQPPTQTPGLTSACPIEQNQIGDGGKFITEGMGDDLDMGVFQESAQHGRGGWVGPEENTWRRDGLHEEPL